MSSKRFEYGPLARGLYTALMWLMLPVAYQYPAYLLHYAGFLLFLGLGLRPLIEALGLDHSLGSLLASADDRLHRRFLEKRRRAVERKVRDDRYRRSRVRDPRLPRNW